MTDKPEGPENTDPLGNRVFSDNPQEVPIEGGSGEDSAVDLDSERQQADQILSDVTNWWDIEIQGNGTKESFFSTFGITGDNIIASISLLNDFRLGYISPEPENMGYHEVNSDGDEERKMVRRIRASDVPGEPSSKEAFYLDRDSFTVGKDTTVVFETPKREGDYWVCSLTSTVKYPQNPDEPWENTI
jgi:hypothetical protein